MKETLWISCRALVLLTFTVPAIPCRIGRRPEAEVIPHMGEFWKRIYFQGNPCCSFPCQHRGVCVTKGSGGYTCDCTRTGYHGNHCQQADLKTLIEEAGKPSRLQAVRMFSENKQHWNIVNKDINMRRQYMKQMIAARAREGDPAMFNSAHFYVTLDSFFNSSYYSRMLPPVPLDCPTPLGVVGKKQLPDADEVGRRLFRRRQFIPDPMKTNVLFAHFAQHFSHTFLKTDFKRGPAFTWGTHHIDGSNIYGPDEAWRRKLRSFRDGKLKSRQINGEEWPPSVAEVPVAMRRLPGQRDEDLFALGHEFYTLSPGLIVIATVWLREHNRVCDVLKAEHPEWDDKQLYQTARNIVTAEVCVVVLEQYLKHVGQYKFDLLLDPTVIFDEGIRFIHSIPYEYNLLYHWHAQAPDFYDVGDQRFSSDQFLFNTSIPVNYGIDALVASAVNQSAGKMSGRNHGASTLKVAVDTLKQSRQLRVQSFNEYRKRSGWEPYKSFIDFTGGDQDLASDLEDLYGHVDALEMFVGMMLEEPRVNIFGYTLGSVAAPTTFQGLMANPLLSSDWWRPSTFGGDTGFNRVKGVSLQSLFCRNTKTCPRVAFTVPT